MAKIIVYNNDTNRMETYYKGEQEAKTKTMLTTIVKL